jgi:hypothetical protein
VLHPHTPNARTHQEFAGGFMLANLVRREPRRNIRVWMSDGANDLEANPDGRRDPFVSGS